MLEWIVRGLRRGRVTTRYPARAEEPAAGFRGRVDVIAGDEPADRALEQLCPTGAIAVRGHGVSLDRGRCILCGACVEAAPERFAFQAAYETAAMRRDGLWVGDVRDPGSWPPGRTLAQSSSTLRNSVSVRHVDAGSDGAEEWEIQALTNPYYDVGRLGITFTPSPRHADILLVTGAVTAPMRAPLERAYAVMPEPRAVIAAGTEACSGALTADGEGVAGGVDRVLPVDVYVPGSPPSPIALLHGILLAMGRLADGPHAAGALEPSQGEGQ